MNIKRPCGLFFTGTGTGVGKTYVAAGVAEQWGRSGVRVGAYKPVASGCHRTAEGRLVNADAVRLHQAINGRFALDQVCPQLFEAPLAPPTAAAAEGREVDEQLLARGFHAMAADCDVVIVEGAGGLMSPLSRRMTNLDLARQLQLPLVVVADNRLGVINNCLLTVTVARQIGALSVAAIVLSEPSSDSDASRSTNLSDLGRWIEDTPVFSVLHDGTIPASFVDYLRGLV